jgi:hypothetical protein
VTMKLHPYTSLILIVLLLALSVVLDACGLIYIDGLIGDYSKEQLLGNSNFRWLRDSSKSCDIFYESGSWAARNTAAIKRNTDSSLVHVLGLLQEPGFPFKINYFIVNDRSQMQSLISRQTNGTAFARERVICAIANDSMSALGPHEMFHVVAMNLWGFTEDWVNEGMAVYSDSTWWVQELHPLANYLRQHGKLLPLIALIQRFSRNDPMITYPQAGSFVKYLCETYGRDNIKVLWQKGLTTFCQSVHAGDLAELERQWLALIATADTGKVHYTIPG